MIFSSSKYALKSSAIRFVSVVTSTRSFFLIRSFILTIRSSICPLTGFIVIAGSTSPVGRMICSTTFSLLFISKGAGVAEV